MRLNLTIADSDELYLDRLVSFLTGGYSQRFQIDSFSNSEHLLRFMQESSKITDILLISTDIYTSQLPQDKYKTLIILSDDRLTEETKLFQRVKKYQHGDRLAGAVISIHSQDMDDILVPDNKGRTKAVAVYSPQGGSGKSTLAACLSIQAAAEGLRAFYLNLESIPSTSLFFNCEGKGSLPDMSNALYFLKDNVKNLSLKLEGTRYVDNSSKVHIFIPSENSFDIDEMLPEELQKLILQMKAMDYYDIVFVDMSSSLSRQNAAVLDVCEEVFVVAVQDVMLEHKLGLLEKQLKTVFYKESRLPKEKFTFILNKFGGNVQYLEGIQSRYGNAFEKLPVFPALNSHGIKEGLKDGANAFGTGVCSLLAKITGSQTKRT